MLQQETSQENQTPIVMGDSFIQAEDGTTVIANSESAPYEPVDSQPPETVVVAHEQSQEPVVIGDEFVEEEDGSSSVTETEDAPYEPVDKADNEQPQYTPPTAPENTEQPVVIGDEFKENEDGSTVITDSESFPLQPQNIETTTTTGQIPPDQLPYDQLATTGSDPLLIAGVGLAVAGTGAALRHRFYSGRKNTSKK